ncbi:MAG: aliphatic amidase AmiE [Flavipsychrobacter sp.]|jgi:predicted amidohydrolase|nr:aliphatic amidase AmiE [Flavipsychrobacter sp.]
MPAAELNITLIQPDIVWEDKEANLRQYEQLIESTRGLKEVVVLPEMFSTGFSMQPELFAETMDGPSVQWMKEMAKKNRCILTGSLMIEQDGNYFNRMLWVQPDGQTGVYDKRHLFAYAEEDRHYSAGSKRVIAQVKGFRICLQVCYDLRFPVWSRNQGDDYDVLLYVANWPERRNLAWKTLLQARAIENQCYVVGVNRVGKDGNDINHSGDSSVFGPLGELIWQQSNEAAVHTVTLQKDTVVNTRQQLPFLKDADRFIILD